MMVGKRHHLTAELLRQNLIRLCPPRLSLQSPCSNGYEHLDPILDQLDIGQVVDDGQQFLFHQ